MKLADHDKAPGWHAVSPGLTAGGGLKRGRRGRYPGGTGVSPGLTAGGGLKLGAVPPECGRQERFPRPHRRGRIETIVRVFDRRKPRVSPGLTAGGGLKHKYRPRTATLSAGFPRPHRRGRIETSRRGACPCSSSRFPRPHRRGRIETSWTRSGWRRSRVSPGLTAGGGLKPFPFVGLDALHHVSPGLTAGGGLKQSGRFVVVYSCLVSPGLTAGGGLKPSRGGRRRRDRRFPPASPPGAD